MIHTLLRRLLFVLLTVVAGAACSSGSSRAKSAYSVAVDPDAIYLAPGTSYTFQATVTGPGDAGQDVTWSVQEGDSGGTVTAAGEYTAPQTEGTYHVVATSTADKHASGSATVTVSKNPVVVVSVRPRNATVAPGGTAQFTATVTGATNTAVTWSVREANGGTVSDSGLYTAPSQGGTFHVVATSQADSRRTGTATAKVSGSGGGDDGGAPTDGPLSVSPEATTLVTGASQKFSCSITCTWSVQEGNGGTVTAAGLYTAPGAGGEYHAVAKGVVDPSKTATVRVTVVDPSAQGVWINVTPVGINLSPDLGGSNNNFGVQDVVADPAKPSDVYAFVCYQGVWRSTDYGVTWTKVSTGDGAAILETGRPWTAAIDPNPLRDPATPPALYTVNGYGSQGGVYKSTDSGVSWTHYEVHGPGDPQAGEDLYSLDIDPYDGQHLIGGFHERPGLAESTNGGQNWTVVNVPGDMGNSVYPNFVDTGNAGTTAKTWLTKAQWGSGANGMWRTADGGGTWNRVDSLEHGHGGDQILQAGGGKIFAAGLSGSQGHGVYMSTDYGATWRMVASGNENGVFGSPNYAYVSNGFNTDPGLQRALTNPGTDWSPMPAPAGMTNGAKRAAVTYDGTHYIIVSGNWRAGIWRYVE